MAESGCLKDGCFQNLQVEGTTILKKSFYRRNIITVTGTSGSDVARTLKEDESSSLILVNNSESGSGDNIQITLPLLNDDTTATTITPGLEFEIILTSTPGHAGALLEISTGDDAVNMNAFSSLLGTSHDDASGQVLGGPGVRGTLGHSKLILTPATPRKH
jgi:hypothetical protein